MRRLPKKINDDSVTVELDSIKRLLALFLLKAGASQGEIAMALNVDRSVVSRMFPARKVKKFNHK